MKRDNDLIREILLTMEDGEKFDGNSWFTIESPEDLGINGHTQDEIVYHLTMLIEHGFIVGQTHMLSPIISKLTWDGHEFIDNVRDTTIWNSVKKSLNGLPSASLSILAQLALSEVKKKVGLS